MDSQTLATKCAARAFYSQGRHVMLVQGSKPAGSEVELLESKAEWNVGDLTLVLTQPQLAPAVESYYLVRPVFAKGPMRPALRLIHQAGRELVRVEPLVCRCAGLHATGSSQDFRFDEAFEDALRQLPFFQSADRSLPLPLVDVVAVGAIYGGFSGYSRLFLRLEASDPALPGA